MNTQDVTGVQIDIEAGGGRCILRIVGSPIALRIVLLASGGIVPTACLAQPPLWGSPVVIQPQGGAGVVSSSPAPPPVARPATPPPRAQPAAAMPLPSGRPIISIPRQPVPSPLQAGPPRAADALPMAGDDPMAIDPARDPVLAYARSATAMTDFRAIVAAAVRRHPMLGESVAAADESRAGRNEARAAGHPTVDMSLSYFNIAARAFSDDALSILERSRPRVRTDGLVTVQQPLVDFGATRNRVRAADARVDAALADIDGVEMQLALRVVAAWSNVFAHRAAVHMGETFVNDQRLLRQALGERVRQGYAAPADVAQMDGYVAAGEAQIADFRRALANAEAHYAELIGSPAPDRLARVPTPAISIGTADDAGQAVDELPTVRAARLLAAAATREAASVRADMMPKVGLGVTAGRYGVFETARDYDVRGSATLSWQLFGGAGPRADQAAARARNAEARSARIREEARRDAVIAQADILALLDAERALAADYIASRRARDTVASRFSVARGTLFDVAVANSNYFSVAARYIQTLTDLDVGRYTFLARTNRLLATLAIQPGTER